MVQLKVMREIQDNEEGFQIDGKLEGTPREIMEELAYACLDITKNLPGDPAMNQAKFIARLTVLCMADNS